MPLSFAAVLRRPAGRQPADRRLYVDLTEHADGWAQDTLRLSDNPRQNSCSHNLDYAKQYAAKDQSVLR